MTIIGIPVVPSTEGITEVESKFQILYRFIGLQTLSEYNLDEHTDADILYTHFETYYSDAIDELADIVTARNITLTVNQEDTALCHLIADYHEMGNPDFSFRSQSQAPGVSFSRGDKTGPRTALDKMLDIIETATRRSMVTCGRGKSITLTKISDASHYPKRFKRTDIPAYDPNGFDEIEVEDLGYSDNQGSTNW